MALVRQILAEPIPGYRLLEPLGKGGFGEVWKCEAPGGLFKAMKFVDGANHVVDTANPGIERELRALEHIRSIRHPFLLSMDRIEFVDGELVIVMELADQSLHDYFHQCRNAGLAGIPRPDLLNHLQEAAEALDLINIRHGLQHLDIKPRNLLLVSLHVKVGDFGLVSRLTEAGSATRQQLAAISPIYASPEVFRGTFSPTSDQYSLAIAYHELLTGELPINGKNFRQLAFAHQQTEPNLQPLPEADRLIVARALAKDPVRRYPSCSDFIQALLTANLPASAIAPSARLRWQSEAPLVSATTMRACEETTAEPPITNPDFGDEVAFPERTLTVRHLTASPAALSAYQFNECLDRSELCEMWMASAPTVGPCIVKFLYGLSDLTPEARTNAVQRMSAVRHPALVPSALVRTESTRLVLVTPRLGTTLRERWQKATSDGSPGIPRTELLSILRDAAQTIDALTQQYNVPHLSLNPDNLQLAQGRTLVADHGLASLFWLPAGQALAGGNVRYAAPELWGNVLSSQGDSYSLAVIYQEMLTGKHPFAASGGKAQCCLQAKPDLTGLPECDRAVMQKALDRTPNHRFATCTDLITALETNTDKGTRGPGSVKPFSDVDITLAPVSQLLHDIIICASGGFLLQEHGSFRFLMQPGQSMRHNFIARVLPRTLPMLLEPFVQRWHAQLFDQGEEMAAYRVLFPGEMRSGSLGRPPGLEVTIHVRTRVTLPPPLTDIRIQIKPFNCTALVADNLLRQTGPSLLEHLRSVLQAHPERRASDRLIYEEPVTIWPLDENGVEQMPLRGDGKDLSRHGLGMYLPRKPPSEQLHIFLTSNGRTVPVPIPARVVRVEPRGDRVEVGTMFLFDSESP
jgi:serine/threonine protein kinase